MSYQSIFFIMFSLALCHSSTNWLETHPSEIGVKVLLESTVNYRRLSNDSSITDMFYLKINNSLHSIKGLVSDDWLHNTTVIDALDDAIIIVKDSVFDFRIHYRFYRYIPSRPSIVRILNINEFKPLTRFDKYFIHLIQFIYPQIYLNDFFLVRTPLEKLLKKKHSLLDLVYIKQNDCLYPINDLLSDDHTNQTANDILLYLEALTMQYTYIWDMFERVEAYIHLPIVPSIIPIPDGLY